MADITDPNEQRSPSAVDDALNLGGAAQGIESRGIKRQRNSTAAGDDDDDDDDKPGRERRKIDIKFITDKSRRHITFSKRKAGIMKKVCYKSPLKTRFLSSKLKLRILADTRYRRMNSLFLPELKFSCLSFPKLVLSTPSPLPSCSHWSPKRMARI